MRTKLTFLVIVCISLFYYRDSVQQLYFRVLHDLPQVAEEIKENLQEPVKRINLPAPLRAITSSKDSTATVLTVSGIIKWTNIQRGTGQVSVLYENVLLNRAAEKKLTDMFNRQYFEHEAPDGTSKAAELAEAQGYKFVVIGENLALGDFTSDQDVVEAWMNSPGHRANIMNNSYQEIGVAVARKDFEGRASWIAVQIFGKPVSSCPIVDEVLKAGIDRNNILISSLNRNLENQRDALNAARKSDSQTYSREVASYNAMVTEYNSLVQDTRRMVEQYNAQVKAYNMCAKT